MADRAARHRWAIAVLVNRVPGQCWADLVSWALDRSQGRLPWRPVTDTCRLDTTQNQGCYCGKLAAPCGDSTTSTALSRRASGDASRPVSGGGG